jgi:hypothetical protein
MVFTFHNKGFNLTIKENSCHTWDKPNTAGRKQRALGNPNAFTRIQDTWGEKANTVARIHGIQDKPKAIARI